MKNKRNRRIALVVAVLMLTMAFSSTGFAAWMGKTMEAQYRNISIFVNSEYKQATDVNGKVVEPFIVDGTIYVPLRGIAQMFGYEVGFNPQTYRIDITGDAAGNSAAAQYEILILEARIAELEDELEEQESSSMDLGDLEDALNDDYDEFDGVDVEDIILDGDEDDIEVEIYIDTTSSSQWDAWKALSDADIEDFLQDIVDDILDEYPDADITGFIEDEYDDKELESFGIDTRGDVDLGGGSSASGDLGDLEDQLIDDYRDIEGIDIENIIIDGDEDDIEVEIYVDLTDTPDFEYWTDDISDTEIENFLQDMIDDILNEFPDADITGFIEDEYDNSEIVDFDIFSDGDVDFNRDL
ncbi:stalk domain-containing protein [Gudongella sp. DL1XJH-153]|uniref:stalk domain-containing protein n=1 Tax=Gudongella sp. DL1XJH-153 TaxID=3409804 RepID=UPI003BB5E418